MLLTGQQIVDELRTKVLRVEGPWDISYLAPQGPWLDKYAFWWRTEILPTLRYEAEEYDCDDFSLRCLVEVKKSILETGIRGSTPAFFIARVSLNLPTNALGIQVGNHVTNICRCANGWYFFEPQNCHIVSFSDALNNAAIDFSFVLV